MFAGLLLMLLPAAATADDSRDGGGRAASGTAAENLLAVYAAARASDPRFRGAEASYQGGLQKLPQARALLLPTVNATARKDRNKDETVTDGAVSGRPAGAAD